MSRYTHLSPKAQEFLNSKPAVIGEVANYTFYENPDPIQGLLIIWADGEGIQRVKATPFYTLPSFDDLQSYLNQINGIY